MKKLVTILVLASGICMAQVDSFVYQGTMRNYITHVPPQGNKLPLVISLHGYTSNASQQQMLSAFNGIADTAGFIVVYPNGVNNAWNAGIGLSSTIDDVGFISALIDTLYKKHGIDRDRVYATGMSNGGFMSQRLACQLSRRIAAIASVAGTIGTAASPFTCNPERIVPVMHIHGTSDNVVNYNGTNFGLSVDSTIKFWVQRDTCPKTPVVTQFPDINTGDGSTVAKNYYGPCRDSSEVILLKVNGGGHSWPGSSLVSGANMDIKASREIWEFFKKHSLKNVSEIIESHLILMENQPVTYLCDCFSKQIRLKMHISGIQAITLYNASGKKVYHFRDTYALKKGAILEISSVHFRSGIYLLNVTAGKSGYSYKLLVL